MQQDDRMRLDNVLNAINVLKQKNSSNKNESTTI